LVLPVLAALAASALAWRQATRLDLDAPAEGLRQDHPRRSTTALTAIVAAVVATTLMQLGLLSQ